MWHQNTTLSWVKSDSCFAVYKKKKKKGMEKSAKAFAGKKLKKTFVAEIREEYLQGLYLLKLGPSQDNEVNEPVNIKSDPGIFMALGRTAGVEPGVLVVGAPAAQAEKKAIQ